MKTTITKSIRHSLLIEDSELRSLYTFISSRYKKVILIANCIDGTRLESEEIDSIISFDNPNYRRIRHISIQANTELDERLSLEVGADKQSSTSELDINSNDDEQALFTSREILNRFKEMKPWYDLLARVLLSNILLVLWALWALILTVFQMVGLRPPSAVLAQYSTLELFNFLLLLVLVVAGIKFVLDRIQKRFFPIVFFSLGKQKKTMETIKKWRTFVFGGVILAILTGVVGNIISHWLIR